MSLVTHPKQASNETYSTTKKPESAKHGNIWKHGIRGYERDRIRFPANEMLVAKTSDSRIIWV